MEDVAHILLDLFLSEVRPNNQDDQGFGQETEDTIEINSSPLSDPVDDSVVINISSDSDSDAATIPYVSLCLHVQNAVPAQPCVGKY